MKVLLLGCAYAAFARATRYHYRVSTVHAPPLVSLNGHNATGYLPSLLQAVQSAASAEGDTLSFDFYASSSVDGALVSLTGGTTDLFLHNELLSRHLSDLGIEAVGPWKNSGIGIIRRDESIHLGTLMDLSSFALGKVCVFKSKVLEDTIDAKHPALVANRLSCNPIGDCVTLLKNGYCELLVMERMQAELLAYADNAIDYIPNGATEYATKPLVFPVASQVDSQRRLALNRYLLAVVDAGTAVNQLDQHYFVGAAQAAKALAGYKVDIVIVVDAPLVMFDSTEKGNKRFSGYCIDIIKEASLDLGFEYQLHLPSDANLAVEYFGTYGQGELDVLNQTVPVEIFWSGYFVTRARMQMFDMAHPFRSTALELLVRDEISTGKALSSTSAVFFPFTPSLWGLLLLTSLFSAAVLWFLEAPARYENDQVEGKLGRSWLGKV
jgi:ABC-type amino acid transport substrate-binding protein